MNHFKNTIGILALLILFFQNAYSQHATFIEAESFYPYAGRLKSEDILWGYLKVPESWSDAGGDSIKIAVSVLRNTQGKAKAEAVVFIQGGPGAGGVQNIWTWLNHPLRETHDVVLFDVRGTGFSEPRLCPDLGKKFLDILAKDQPAAQDEKQKIEAAISCKNDLIKNGIDIKEYNSSSVAKDLNALKSALKYDKWHVYGVSYGTYMAQTYARQYPQSIASLILDSSIDEISDYYEKNTSNYLYSLAKVIEACKNDETCNRQYPELEKVYFETIANLEENPITVEVNKNLVSTGQFTYNAEDFKVAIQQALYHKQLVEIIPLTIYQFHRRNHGALGNLVSAFSNLLGMDYGVYYCVSCYEALPKNNIHEFDKDASRFARLKGGLAFYRSDFAVCAEWNTGNIQPSDSTLAVDSTWSGANKEQNFPVMVFAGEYDPITPLGNGEKVARKFSNAIHLTAYTYGHAPGFTKIGNHVTTQFIKNTQGDIDIEAFKAAPEMRLVKDITLNAGVSKMGNSLNRLDPVFMVPLAIALLTMIAFVLTHSIKLLRKKYTLMHDKIIRAFNIITSIVGIWSVTGLVIALLRVSGQNYFILAFGLPNDFGYLFSLVLIFPALLVITIVYFFAAIKRINDKSIVFTIIFSNAVLAAYFVYWGII